MTRRINNILIITLITHTNIFHPENFAKKHGTKSASILNSCSGKRIKASARYKYFRKLTFRLNRYLFVCTPACTIPRGRFPREGNTGLHSISLFLSLPPPSLLPLQCLSARVVTRAIVALCYVACVKEIWNDPRVSLRHCV